MPGALGWLGEILDVVRTIPPGELHMRNVRRSALGSTPEAAADRFGALIGGAVESSALIAVPPGLGPAAALVCSANVWALQTLGAGIAAMTEHEQALTATVGAISMGAVPALTAGATVLGLPHAHMHPPNLVPPNPVPLALPSAGSVATIPFLSTASTVLIGGRPAARCEDMGLALGCGGFFPMFEILFGSSSVWIEGARAATVNTGITRHCMLSSRGPTDPPLGPMAGSVMPVPATVLIGGAPMPSLTSLAISTGLRMVFASGARAYMRFTAHAHVDALLAGGRVRIAGPAAYTALVKQDLVALATTRSGRETLGRIEASGRTVTIEPMPHVRNEHLPNGSIGRTLVDEHNAWAASPNRADAVFDVAGARGPGTDVTIAHSPERWANHGGGDQVVMDLDAAGNLHRRRSPPPPGTASDEVLMHEMTHAANFANGEGRMSVRGQPGPYEPGGPEWGRRWKNGEEFVAVWAENGYRRERRGILARQRTEYGALP